MRLQTKIIATQMGLQILNCETQEVANMLGSSSFTRGEPHQKIFGRKVPSLIAQQ